MHIACAFPSIIAGSRKRLVFMDIGGNYNSDDFEIYTTGSIDLGTVAALKATDFEQFTGQALSFVRDVYTRSSVDFESMDNGAINNIPKLNSEGYEANSLNVSGTCSAVYARAYHDFEIYPTGSPSFAPFDFPYGFPQPTGAKTQIFP